MGEVVLAEKELLIGSLSGPNFPIWTTKIDCSRKDLTKSCFWKNFRRKDGFV